MTAAELDADLRSRLARLAEARARSPEGLMRDAIVQFLLREEARERLQADALAAWDEYRATGLHVTAEAADAWLARLETGEQADPPACHR